MRGGLHQRDDSFVVFPVEKSLSLTNEDFVPLIVLSGSQHYGLLGLQEAVEDLRCGLHLFLQGSVGDEAHVEHADEAVNVESTVRHQPLVELLLQTWKGGGMVKHYCTVKTPPPDGKCKTFKKFFIGGLNK